MEPLGGAKPHRASCRPSARQRKRRLQSCSDTESCASAGPPLVHKVGHTRGEHGGDGQGRVA